MTVTLIILAHPDARSFNGAWAHASAEASRALGHEVLWLHLNARRFDPVDGPAHYPGQAADAPFDMLKAQEAAASEGTLPGDVAEQIDMLRRADRVIFHFPLWWFAPPAILKGWAERVLAHGALHTTDERFDTGRCRGKTALFCVTTGSRASESAFNGKEGDVRLLLWPMAYTLRYLGFTVLEPLTLHGIHGYHKGTRKAELEDRLGAALAAQQDVIAGFDDRATMAFNADDEFDAEGRLRPDAPSHGPFIRHAP